MSQVITETDNLKAVGPYSLVREMNGILYISGQVGIDKDYKVVEGGAESEFKIIMKNVEELLKIAGYEITNVVKVNLYLVFLDDYIKVNELYKEFFKEPFPVRTTVKVAGLPLGCKIELDLVAVK